MTTISEKKELTVSNKNVVFHELLRFFDNIETLVCR